MQCLTLNRVNKAIYTEIQPSCISNRKTVHKSMNDHRGEGELFTVSKSCSQVVSTVPISSEQIGCCGLSGATGEAPVQSAERREPGLRTHRFAYATVQSKKREIERRQLKDYGCNVHVHYCGATINAACRFQHVMFISAFTKNCCG